MSSASPFLAGLILMLAACSCTNSGTGKAARARAEGGRTAATSTASGAAPAGAPAASPAAAPSPPVAPAPGPAPFEADAFETSVGPTEIIAAYLTAFRDAPSAVDGADITVFAVVRDAGGKPLPKPLPLDLAVASFDDGAEVAGVADADPAHEYHVVFKIPQAQLASLSIGKDRIKGKIRVASAGFATPTLETEVVIWLANVALTVEQTNFGVLALAKPGEAQPPIKVRVAVSGKEQPAQRSLLKGLGGDLIVNGGDCPTLSEFVPQDLRSDCELVLEPRGITALDRVLTLRYYNGVREDFASVIVRGETALTLASGESIVALAARDGQLLAATRDKIFVWNSLPERSDAPPDVVLEAAVASMTFVGKRLFAVRVVPPRAGSLLIWDEVPTTAGRSPDFELPGLYNPRAGLSFDGNHLFVGEWRINDWEAPGDFSRFLLFGDLGAGLPSVVGTFPGAATPTKEFVGRLGFAGGRTFEMNVQRLRIWNAARPQDYFHADQTLGGPYFGLVGGAGGVAPIPATEPADPRGARSVSSDGTTLAIADDSRVLVWERWPTKDDAPADFVLGQPNFQSRQGNVFGSSIESLSGVSSVQVIGDAVAIADAGNKRLVVRRMPRERPKLEMPKRMEGYLSGESTPSLLAFASTAFELGILDREATTNEVSIAVEYSGSLPATVRDARFDRGDFQFVGGAYPGTGGTCGSAIRSGCLLRIAVVGKAQGRRRATLELEYDGGTGPRTVAITLLASVRAVALEQLPEWSEVSVTASGDAMQLANCLYLYRGTGDFATNRPRIALGAREEKGCSFDFVASAYDFFGPTMASISDGRLYVADTDGDLVVYRSLPSTGGAPSDFRLSIGETGFSVFQADYLRYTTVSAGAVLTTSGRLYAATCGARKNILVWNAIPDADVAPDVAFDYSASLGDVCVTDIFLVDGKFVAAFRSIDGKLAGAFKYNADPNGSSGGLLIWSTPPSIAREPDAIVDGLLRPGHPAGGFAWDGSRFYAIDATAHAVDVWFGLPEAGQTPDVVLGQLDKGGVEQDAGGNGPWSLSAPHLVSAANDRVYVGDGYGLKVFKAPTP